MTSLSTLTDRFAVDAALDEFDELGRSAFLHKYGFREAKEYFLVTEEGHYDSKAIFAAAYEREHGIRLTNEDFHGGKQGAAKWLSDLGYTIEGFESKVGRLTFDSFEAALNEYQLPIENITIAREYVSRHDYEEFYIPPSRTYIAMIPRGEERPTGWIQKGYISFRNDDGTHDSMTLPYSRVRGGGRDSRQRRREEAEQNCLTPGCGMVLSVSGECSLCG